MPGHFFVYFPTLPPLNVTPSFPNLSRVFLLSFHGPFHTLFSSIPRCASFLLPLYFSAFSQLRSVRQPSVLLFLSFCLLSISPLHNSPASHFGLFLFLIPFFFLIPYSSSRLILLFLVLPSLSSLLILLLNLFFSSQSSPL
jgi:hypothetical protein